MNPPGRLGDADLALEPHERLRRSVLPLAETPPAFAAGVRRAIRCPGLVYRRPRRWEPAPGEARAVWVGVDAATLMDLRSELGHLPAYRGLVLLSSDLLTHRRPDRTHLQVALRFLVRLPGAPLALHAVFPLLDTEEVVDVVLRQRAAAALTQAGIDLRGGGLAAGIERQGSAELLTRTDPSLRAALEEAPELTSLDELFGPARCAHPRGVWEPAEDGAALWLSCQDCCHQRLARAPRSASASRLAELVAAAVLPPPKRPVADLRSAFAGRRRL